jgi:hypothetical protein
MGAVLTESSSVACGHTPGTVQLRAGQSKLTVNGNKVLVDGDLMGASISSCSTPSTQSSSPCATVSSTVGGVAQKLTVGGKGVLLDNITGVTSGVPPGSLSVSNAGQTKLTTT